MLLEGNHFKYKDSDGLKEKCGKTYANQKEATVATLISDKVKFRAKTIISGKEGHCIITRGSVIPEDIIILNVCVLNSKIHEIKAYRTARRNK